MKIFFLGAPIAPHPLPSATLEQKFRHSGRNSGNLLIGHSLFRELVCESYGYGTNYPRERIDRDFDVIVIAAANFVSSHSDLSAVASLIESTKLPCVVVGLGAQAPDKGKTAIDLQEGTLRFLNVISERSKLIGVRGHFTAEVLNQLGIKNVCPVGCPSLYRSLNRNLKIRVPRFSNISDVKVSLNGSRNVINHSSSPELARKVEASILQLSFEHGFSYVLQNETPEMQVLCGETDPRGFLPQLNTLVERLELPFSAEQYLNLIQRNFRLFFNVEEWDAYIKAFDCCFGSRFHGNIVALTNGVAATLLTHDSRTTEMAELMSIPHVPVESALPLYLEELIENSDYAAFEEKYRVLYDRYAEFLSIVGLEHRLLAAERTISSGGKIARERKGLYR